jgi:hypothetical protein
MPVVLNPTGTGTQDPRRPEMFVRLDLPDSAKDFVVFRSFVSNNSLNDFLPDKNMKWPQTTVGMPKALLELARRNPNFQHRLLRENPDGEKTTLGPDDGMILKFEGSYAGDRYVDRGRMVSDDDADIMMEAGHAVPQFAMWEFRLKEVIATDGPQRREDILSNAEHKAAKEREGMFGAITDAFKAVMGPTNPEPLTLAEAEGQEELAKSTSSELSSKMKAALSAAKGE